VEILSSSALRETEKTVTERYGIPVFALRERAALAVYEECAKRRPKPAKVLVLAGRGNNGTDGLAAARIFLCGGYPVSALLLSGKTPEQTAENTILSKLNADTAEISSLEDIQKNSDKFTGSDIIIDALLGIGANRPAEGVLAELIRAANAASALKVSVDIPSGLTADSPQITGEIFRADITVTFTRSKPSFHLPPAKAFCGEVIIREIGIPPFLIDSPLHLLDNGNTPPPPGRAPFGYKNLYGHAVIAGGSSGKSGAAVMAASAALRAGAGLVTCILPKGLNGAVYTRPELMSFFGDTENAFSEKDAEKVLKFLKPGMTLALGPGLGRSDETAAFVRTLLKKRNLLTILDADALYALDNATLSAVEQHAVLTPHPGEFFMLASRSFGEMNKEEVELNRLALSKEYALKHKLVLVLKGTETIISTPGGTQFISEWGDPALSKGGSGDLLTGIITALIAQGTAEEDAVKTACRTQGDAARAASAKCSASSVTPIDILNNIGVC
jgi:NAD(P)H-hydrate epimerase